MESKNRTILHVDLDAFYASVESVYDQSLKGKPIAVIGDPEARHGIVLAKSYEAKAFGVKTGEPIWQAKQKCKDIIFVPANYKRYLKYSKMSKEIFSDYSDRCESFGLDESWLDVTGCTLLFGDGKTIANTIRRRIENELGLTASVGVSFNKIFAKLGSDMNKPNGITIIPYDNFKEIVWQLPVNDLLYVGSATTKKFHSYGIFTIGNLAKTELTFLESRFGKIGNMLWLFANGLDASHVSNIDSNRLIKSIGNSTTTPRDLITDDDVRITLYSLCESISARLRGNNLKCKGIQLRIREKNLFSYDRQLTLLRPTSITDDIFNAAFQLYKKNHTLGIPIRSLGVRAINLEIEDIFQLSFLPEERKAQANEALENAIDNIRLKYGHFAIQRGIMLTDLELSNLNPREDHIIFPIGFLGSIK